MLERTPAKEFRPPPSVDGRLGSAEVPFGAGRVGLAWVVALNRRRRARRSPEPHQVSPSQGCCASAPLVGASGWLFAASDDAPPYPRGRKPCSNPLRTRSAPLCPPKAVRILRMYRSTVFSDTPIAREISL